MGHRTVTRLLTMMGVWVFAAAGLQAAAPREPHPTERIDCRSAVWRVYQSHQIGDTRSFEEAVPRSWIEDRVREEQRQQVALEREFGVAIRAADLEAELDRIAAATAMPQRLVELYGALGNDPLLVHECLLKPVWVSRKLREAFARSESIHAAARRRIETVQLDLLLGKTPADFDGVSALADADPGELDAGSPHEVGPILDRGGAFTVARRDAHGIRRYSVTKTSWTAWWRDHAETFDERGARAVPGLASLALPEPGSVRAGQEESAHTRTLLLGWRNGALAAPPPDVALGGPGIWTGNEWIVWGAISGDPSSAIHGRRYDPTLDSWTTTTASGAPFARAYPVAVWAGTRMLVSGGYTSGQGNGWNPIGSGGAYDPLLDAWSPVAVGGTGARAEAIWTGQELISFGGTPCGDKQVCRHCSSDTNPLEIYDPVTNLWSAPNPPGAPLSRLGHTAVWTGTELIVWGGRREILGAQSCEVTMLDSGARYDPVANTWTPMSTVGAPSPRMGHTAVWTGDRMIVWGGQPGPTHDFFTDDWSVPGLADGAAYDPSTDTWTPIASLDAPAGRMIHAAVWTGSEMIVWGGMSAGVPESTGGIYDPATDRWVQPTPLEDAPLLDDQLYAAWTGSSLLVWDALNRAGGRLALLAGDEDGDFIGDAADNCPLVANVSQDDLDADGSGDACDCDPGDPTDGEPQAVSLSLARPGGVTELQWSAVPKADGYSVTRGLLSTLAFGTYGSCLAEGVDGTSLPDATPVTAGDAFVYLVQAQNHECGLGLLASDSLVPRQNGDAGACIGVDVIDVVPDSSTPVDGTVSGTLVEVGGSDDALFEITEIISSGGNPSLRYSFLEHRWTIPVVAGGKLSLHVEGFRTDSVDGDTFVFEYFDGAVWVEVPLAPLPLSTACGSFDCDVDWSGPLPPTLNGSVTFRVRDSDRSPGAQDLDTVSIDHLFVRVIP